MNDKKIKFTNYLNEHEILDLLFEKILDTNTSDFCSVVSNVLGMKVIYIEDKDLYMIETKFEIDIN
jgi:hypothetical protein